MSTRNPNTPWDRQWRVPKPADYVSGLYRMHQMSAHHVLRSGAFLTEHEAEALQRLAYQSGDASKLQVRWLDRMEARVAHFVAMNPRQCQVIDFAAHRERRQAIAAGAESDDYDPFAPEPPLLPPDPPRAA